MRLHGRAVIPGDKGISHRALLISSISEGKSIIRGLNRGSDCAKTIGCLQNLGVPITQDGGDWVVFGRGFQLSQPNEVLDCGYSGTTLRLLAGVLSGQDFLSILDGNESLRLRPMGRVVEPLRLMGADLFGPAGSNLAPLSVRGGSLKGMTYELPVPSAQVKGAVLLASSQTHEKTTIIEPITCADHMEKMLQSAGANIQIEPNKIQITGGVNLTSRVYDVPGDFSAAAILISAAAGLEGSEIVLENVGLNPSRAGYLEVLKSMGASIEIVDLVEDQGGELRGTVIARSSKLQATTVKGEIIPRLLDDIPILAVLATQAEGTTIIDDANELRVKESDRLTNLATELNKLGAQIKELPNGLEITGPTKLKGGSVSCYHDHRLALAFRVAGLFSEERVTFTDKNRHKISFPEFQSIWGELITG